MNNMPYFNQNYMPNEIDLMFEKLNNRINRSERQIKILENRLNRLENVNVKKLNTFEEDNNMYML